MKTSSFDTNCSPKQAQIIIDLLSHDFMKKEGIKHLDCFECGGEIFLGSYEWAVREFAYNNPDGGDFCVWVQQKFYRLTKNPIGR